MTVGARWTRGVLWVGFGLFFLFSMRSLARLWFVLRCFSIRLLLFPFQILIGTPVPSVEGFSSLT